MDLRRLEALNAVVDEGSFEKAARRLCCAQSTVTFQIRQLEQELGLQLFEKVGRRMRLTEAGHGLMPQVRELARTLDGLRAAARREEPRGLLRVAVGETLLAYKLPEVLRRFRVRAPEARLHLQSLNCYVIRDALLNGAADVGVFYSQGPDASLAQESLGDFPLALVAAPQSADMDFTRPDQKLPTSLIINEPQCMFRLFFENTLRRRNISLNGTTELLSIESIKNCVAADLGVSYLPRFCVERELREGLLRELPFVEPAHTLRAVCARHVNKARSPALRLFTALAEECIGGVLPDGAGPDSRPTDRMQKTPPQDLTAARR